MQACIVKKYFNSWAGHCHTDDLVSKEKASTKPKLQIVTTKQTQYKALDASIIAVSCAISLRERGNGSSYKLIKLLQTTQQYTRVISCYCQEWYYQQMLRTAALCLAVRPPHFARAL